MGVALLVGFLLPGPALALDVLVNQAGFEHNAPKVFHVQRTTDFAGDGTFSLRRASDNATVFTGPLIRKGGLWDRWYWQGDFSSWRIGGDFNLQATVGTETNTSFPFAIGGDLLLSKTGALAFRYFLTQRCGTAVTDPYDGTFWHGLCHADDGIRSDTKVHIDAAGGWHDAGDYGKFPHGFAGNGLFDLLWLYDTNRTYFDAQDLTGNGIPDILDECLHQARWLAKMVDANGHCLQQTRKHRCGSSFVSPEADANNTICQCAAPSNCDGDQFCINECDDRWIDPGDENTPQETVVCAGLIRMHRVLASRGMPTENFAAKALSIWNHRVAWAISDGGHNNLGSGAHHIWAGLDLFDVFAQQDCFDRAVSRVSELAGSVIANPGLFDSIIYAEPPGYELGVLAWFARTYPNAPHTPQARTAIAALMDRNINYLASDRIGLIRRDDNGTLEYFPTNPDNNGFFLGINRLYLLMTWGAIEAHKTLNNPAYLRFAMDQLNWVLGANYFRVCMVHGAGTSHPLSYHHRYTPPPGWPRGSQPGVVPNGIVRTYSTGLPQFDLSTTYPARYQTNECWLINNAAYAMALANMNVFRDDAQIVSNTIPTTMTAGLTYPVSITVKNTSYLTWSNADNYRLGTVDDSDPLAGGRQLIPAGSTVAPGQNHTFVFNMIAPSTPGIYTTDWRMLQELVNWFGQTLVKQVEVISAAPPAPVTLFTATAQTAQVTLSWTNPTSPGFTGTLIRASTRGYPGNPADGVLVADRPNTPGSSDSVIHANLPKGVRQYYAAFAYNAVPAYATPALATAIPTFQADFDDDGDVDLSDFARLQRCFSGTVLPYGPECEAADLNGDFAVDGGDFQLFLACLGGPDHAPLASCMH